MCLICESCVWLLTWRCRSDRFSDASEAHVAPCTRLLWVQLCFHMQYALFKICQNYICPSLPVNGLKTHLKYFWPFKKNQFHFSNAACSQLPSSFRPKELCVSYSETLDCVTTEWESALKAKKETDLSYRNLSWTITWKLNSSQTPHFVKFYWQ